MAHPQAKETDYVTVTDRIDEMRLRPGDTIRLRQNFKRGPWWEYELTLLWHGEQIAVWSSRHRSESNPDQWSEPKETAAPDLAYGDWARVDPAATRLED